MRSALVLDALEHALWARRRDGRGGLRGLRAERTLIMPLVLHGNL
jgi:hypothetical protein